MLTRNRHVRSVMAGRQGLRRNLSVFTRGWAMATHPALCAGHRPLVVMGVTVDHPQRGSRWLAGSSWRAHTLARGRHAGVGRRVGTQNPDKVLAKIILGPPPQRHLRAARGEPPYALMGFSAAARPFARITQCLVCVYPIETHPPNDVEHPLLLPPGTCDRHVLP
jgi:hypothetical protein